MTSWLNKEMEFVSVFNHDSSSLVRQCARYSLAPQAPEEWEPLRPFGGVPFRFPSSQRMGALPACSVLAAERRANPKHEGGQAINESY